MTEPNKILDKRTAKLLIKFSDILQSTGDPDEPRLYKMYIQNQDNEMFVYMSRLCLKVYTKERQKARRAALEKSE